MSDSDSSDTNVSHIDGLDQSTFPPPPVQLPIVSHTMSVTSNIITPNVLSTHSPDEVTSSESTQLIVPPPPAILPIPTIIDIPVQVSTINPKIHEVAHHGSINEALSSEYITSFEVMMYLHNVNVDAYSIGVYSSLCKYLTPNNHYVNGIHFIYLTQKVEYALLYLLNGGVEHTQITDDEFKLIDHPKFDASPTQDMTPVLFQAMLILNGHERQMWNSRMTLMQAISSASESPCMWIVMNENPDIVTMGARKLLIEGIVRSDNEGDLKTIPFGEIKTYLFDRIVHLLNVVPLYWENVAKMIYLNVFKYHHIDHICPGITTTDFDLICTFFPDLIKVENNDGPVGTPIEFYRKFKAFPKVKRAYLLGYPIHKYVPSNTVMNESISKLYEMGVDTYCSHIETYVRSKITNNRLMSVVPNDHNDKSLANEHDVMGDSIYLYSPFDIVIAHSDTHYHVFTRPEFKTLVETKKNCWTNEILDNSIINTIAGRLETSVDNNLPGNPGENASEIYNCIPLKEMIQMVISGEIMPDDNDVCSICGKVRILDESDSSSDESDTYDHHNILEGSLTIMNNIESPQPIGNHGMSTNVMFINNLISNINTDNIGNNLPQEDIDSLRLLSTFFGMYLL